MFVHNYSRRSDEAGFKVEIEFDGQIYEIEYDKVVPQDAKVSVAKLRYSKARGIELIESLPSQASTQQMWGIHTESFVDVNTIMLSPNHWGDSATGNKHYFFVLDGCHTDEAMRGIYNEFLRGDLTTHGKVFEVLGAKTMVAPTSEQLSGVGFSETQPQVVTVRVTGQKLSKTYNVKF